MSVTLGIVIIIGLLIVGVFTAIITISLASTSTTKTTTTIKFLTCAVDGCGNEVYTIQNGDALCATHTG